VIFWKIKRKMMEQKGFTLMELAVVIAIIGILTAMLLPKFDEVTQAAKISRGKVDFRTIVSALELYYGAKGKYPLVSTDEDLLKYLGKWPAGAEYSSDGTSYALLIKVGSYEINKDNL